MTICGQSSDFSSFMYERSEDEMKYWSKHGVMQSDVMSNSDYRRLMAEMISKEKSA